MQFLLTRVMIILLAEAKRLTDITKERTEERGEDRQWHSY